MLITQGLWQGHWQVSGTELCRSALWLIVSACSNHAVWEPSPVICIRFCKSFFLQGYNLRLLSDQINLMSDYIAKITCMSQPFSCCAPPQFRYPNSNQLRAYPPPIIINFQLSHSTSSWWHKHNCCHNGKPARNTFTWHLSKAKLFSMSKHVGNSGLHWSLWKKTWRPKGNSVKGWI